MAKKGPTYLTCQIESGISAATGVVMQKIISALLLGFLFVSEFSLANQTLPSDGCLEPLTVASQGDDEFEVFLNDLIKQVREHVGNRLANYLVRPDVESDLWNEKSQWSPAVLKVLSPLERKIFYIRFVAKLPLPPIAGLTDAQKSRVLQNIFQHLKARPLTREALSQLQLRYYNFLLSELGSSPVLETKRTHWLSLFGMSDVSVQTVAMAWINQTGDKNYRRIWWMQLLTGLSDAEISSVLKASTSDFERQRQQIETNARDRMFNILATLYNRDEISDKDPLYQALLSGLGHGTVTDQWGDDDEQAEYQDGPGPDPNLKFSKEEVLAFIKSIRPHLAHRNPKSFGLMITDEVQPQFQAIVSQLNRLSGRDRQLWILRHVQSRTTYEVAAIANIDSGLADRQLNQIRKSAGFPGFLKNTAP